MNRTQRVFIVDDDQNVRESLAALVSAHGLDVRTYESAEQFLESGDYRIPGCVVADMRMRGTSGSELTTTMRREGITSPVILITGYVDTDCMTEDIGSENVILLEKSCASEAFWEAIARTLKISSE